MDGFQSSQMNTSLFSSNSKHPDVQNMKGRESMNTDDLYNQYQNQQQGSTLVRYRSAPSSFFASLIDDGGEEEEEDLLNRQSSSGSESIFETTAEKKQYSSIYETSLDRRDFVNQNESWVTSTCGGGGGGDLQGFYYKDDMAMENNSIMEHGKKSGGGAVGGGSSNCSNLIRQSSSPAVFFSALTADTGFGDMKDVGSFKAGNGTNGKASTSNRFNGIINFSSGPSSSSRFMPKITESGNGNGTIEASSPQTRFQNDSWTVTDLKRNRDDNESQLFGFNALNGDSSSYARGLTHHLSLPKTSAEMDAVEKFLQFQQDSIPCKIRAKRGCATHPRSIAERTRRTRISERIRKLQELFPKMDKQTSTADMLDWAVEYIKDLQKEVKTLTDKESKCTCSGEGKQVPNPTL
ncbi:transcription factor bHLH130-like [Rhododendron vialii]|uniref:transcription factor bHLH130-like n=1 Tax=Rhododendron vialii TaxID=182163 RepID=UPI00265FEF90|nr:transcription factor bHLH130-like [Rhododendron vialii]